MKKLILILNIGLLTFASTFTASAAPLTPVVVSSTPFVEDSRWEQRDGFWYYYRDDSLVTGWIQDKNIWYYLDTDGRMLTGWQVIDNSTYYFNTDGAMVSGEAFIDGSSYTFHENGHLLFKGIHRNGMEDDLITAAFESTQKYQAEIHEMISQVNEHRRSNGKHELRYDENLSVIAAYRAAHMAKYNYYSHYYNGNLHFVDATKNFLGRSGGLKENMNRVFFNPGIIPKNHNTIIASKINGLMNSLVNSPNPNKILLSSEVDRVGIGYYVSPDFREVVTVQIFAPNW